MTRKSKPLSGGLLQILLSRLLKLVAVYRNRQQRQNRVTEQLLEEQQPVRLEPLEARERLSRVSKQVLAERSERLEQPELPELLDKPDKLQDERLALVPLRPEQVQLRPVLEQAELEVSEQELLLVREERQSLEHRLLLPERLEQPVLELLDSLVRTPIPVQLDNLVRIPIRQQQALPDKR